ncbi:sugar phosphate nucleotidyltransferase [Chlorobium phaeobacteroides]|uniref:Nucleotidyltransferase n=1 Tax=Chlorobium phaeobacteroides (strain DSM 266 / SMG 266 / 2430) TaxID=290317 RepID=A1BCZ4_CHLPD|nr:sugar phosphate nucleotidyltransferase [Chlorobium phaeobacteroides]ABL64271.1 nucleotidyltransferase [Chlorobium phaeobacteroides DSM 266]
MKAFVLAAGFGTRLRPFTHRIPKPLIPVLNLPALLYTFALLKDAGITDIICNIHHHADDVRESVASFGIEGLAISFSEETTILGTGGGLKKCEQLFDDEDFLLINSDIITDIDFSAFIRHHKLSGLPGTLALYETPEAMAIGCIGIENGQVKDFRNMRNTGLKSSLIYTGTALLSPKIFRYLNEDFSSIVDTGFTGLIDHGGLGAFRHSGSWMDIGTPEDYLDANNGKGMLPERLTRRVRDAIGIEPHRIAADAWIASGARVIRSVIGSRCMVSRNAVVENSVLLPGAVVAEGECLLNSIRDRENTLQTIP